mmetsp:Transcript_42158/g.82695  ORF Transcript_42158/g.82695 Transcript_42158/m.82695 type:complete len:414 (-) Transcript_42158:44-1285(-)
MEFFSVRMWSAGVRLFVVSVVLSAAAGSSSSGAVFKIYGTRPTALVRPAEGPGGEIGRDLAGRRRTRYATVGCGAARERPSAAAAFGLVVRGGVTAEQPTTTRKKRKKKSRSSVASKSKRAHPEAVPVRIETGSTSLIKRIQMFVRTLPSPIDRAVEYVMSFISDLAGFGWPRVAEEGGAEKKPKKKVGGPADKSTTKGKKRASAKAAPPSDERGAAKGRGGGAGKKKTGPGGAGGAGKKRTPTKGKDAPPSLLTVDAAHLAKDLAASSPNYRIQRELRAFLSSPPDGCRVAVGRNIRVWIVTLDGFPEGSVFAGEKFRLRISFPGDYPAAPPSCYFLRPTPRHEHVYTNGDICLSLLGKDWRPTMTAATLSISILSILSSARAKAIPQDNAMHAGNKPGGSQHNWVYHDDSC